MKAGLHKFITYKKFAKNVFYLKKKLIKIFEEIKSKKGKIIGYGASAKAVTVVNYCNLKENFFDHFIDTTKSKIGKYLPGTKIIVRKYDKSKLDKNAFDPTKNSPPNPWLVKLENRIQNYYQIN